MGSFDYWGEMIGVYPYISKHNITDIFGMGTAMLGFEDGIRNFLTEQCHTMTHVKLLNKFLTYALSLTIAGWKNPGSDNLVFSGALP